MFSLIKNELYKIFHKKGTYIFCLIVIGFIVLTNFIYRMDPVSFVMSSDKDLAADTEMLEYLKKNNGTEAEIMSTEVSIMVNQFLIDNNIKYQSWKTKYVNSLYYNILYSMKSAEKNGNNEEYNLAIAAKEEFEQKIKDNDWKYFITDEITNLKEELNSLPVGVSNNIQKENLRLLEYQLENDIEPSEDNYKYTLIENMRVTYEAVDKYENSKDSLDKLEGFERTTIENQVRSYNISKYELENNINGDEVASVYKVITNIFIEYGFLILVFVIMISSSIVSDEYSKGTIKGLLITPYSRTKILISKFIACFIMFLFIYVFVMIMEIIIGGIILGFDSLSVPVVSYDIVKNEIIVMNLFKYSFLLLLYTLPMFIIIMTFAFMLSTTIGNTTFASVMSFCLYIGSSIINALTISFNLEFLKFFVSNTWNMSELLTQGFMNNGIGFTQALITNVIYFVLMFILCVVVFKRKNIKNI